MKNILTIVLLLASFISFCQKDLIKEMEAKSKETLHALAKADAEIKAKVSEQEAKDKKAFEEQDIALKNKLKEMEYATQKQIKEIEEKSKVVISDSKARKLKNIKAKQK